MPPGTVTSSPSWAAHANPPLLFQRVKFFQMSNLTFSPYVEELPFFLFSCAPEHIQMWAIMWQVVNCKLLHSGPVVSYSRGNIECKTLFCVFWKRSLVFPKEYGLDRRGTKHWSGLYRWEVNPVLIWTRRFYCFCKLPSKMIVQLFFFPRVILIRSRKHISVRQNIVHVSTYSEFLRLS